MAICAKSANTMCETYVHKPLDVCDRIGITRIVDLNNNFVMEPAPTDNGKYDALTRDIIWDVGDGMGVSLLCIAFIARLADIGIVCSTPWDVSCREAGMDICEMRYTGNGKGVFVLDGEDIADTVVDVRELVVRYTLGI